MANKKSNKNEKAKVVSIDATSESIQIPENDNASLYRFGPILNGRVNTRAGHTVEAPSFKLGGRSMFGSKKKKD